jgi:hypothetical protein
MAIYAASPWYDSGTLVSVAGVVVSVLAILVTVWGALYAIRPRQALYYKLKSAKPVRDSDASPLRASASGLAHPKVLTICLQVAGARMSPARPLTQPSRLLLTPAVPSSGRLVTRSAIRRGVRCRRHGWPAAC